MADLKPLEYETALEFVERANTLEAPDGAIDIALKEHFNIADRDVKQLKLKSSVFWQEFFYNHVLELHQRGGSRYAAIKFIHKKNGVAGQKELSEQQIEELVDLVGEWKR